MHTRKVTFTVRFSFNPRLERRSLLEQTFNGAGTKRRIRLSGKVLPFYSGEKTGMTSLDDLK